MLKACHLHFSFISFQGRHRFSFFFFFFFPPLPLSSICCLSSAERAVSGSEHVVVFSFLMPWVLRMSRGRYHMEGDQRRDSGPANRLHVQVLEIFCYHRASRVYILVQGPQSGLSADAKSSLISQISLYPKISCFFLPPPSIKPLSVLSSSSPSVCGTLTGCPRHTWWRSLSFFNVLRGE